MDCSNAYFTNSSDFKYVIIYTQSMDTIIISHDWLKAKGLSSISEVHGRNTNAIPIEIQDSFNNFISTLRLNTNSYALQYSDKHKMLRILMSDYCNLNCAYCKVMPNINHTKSSLDIQKLLPQVDYFLANSREYPIIEYSGGEPLLESKALLLLMKYAKSKCKSVTNVISTNGTLLTEEFLIESKKYDAKYLISIDGFQMTHDKLRPYHNSKGSYCDVINAIDLLKNHDIEFGLSCVVGENNVNKIVDELYELCNKYSPSSLGLNFLKYPIFGEKNDSLQTSPEKYVESVYELYKKIRCDGIFVEQLDRRIQPYVYQVKRKFDCGAATGNLNLDPHGEMGPCKSFLVLRKEYLESENDMHISDFYSKLSNQLENQDKCITCKARNICGGGCAYESCTEGTGQISVNHCRIVRSMFDKILEDVAALNYEVVDQKGYLLLGFNERNKLMGNIKRSHVPMKYSLGHFLPIVKRIDQ